jgi:putative chitinase
MQLTTENLQKANVGSTLLPSVLAAFNSNCEGFGVTSFLRTVHFMAQVCHESNGFRKNVESMTYTTPERLMVVWPSRFKTLESAKPFVNNPEKLGNNVYANRMGNGGPETGDGFRYRGRGPMQTTGKDAYKTVSLKVFGDTRLLDNPDLLTNLNVGLLGAFIEWKEKGCNAFADADDITTITKRINGGLTGFDGRKIWLATWKQVLANNPAVV